MVRFFVDPSEMEQEYIRLSGENLSHAKVLRIRHGEEILVCNGQGMECLCIVDEVQKEQMTLSVIDRRESVAEPSVKASIYMAFPKTDKLEHVIQKATELGVYEIVVFPSARCVSRPDEKSIAKKLERWNKIALSASEQSGRGRVPEVVVLGSYREAVCRATRADLAVIFYEDEHRNTFRDALDATPYSSISLLTGPEGGLEEHEVTEAIEAGMRCCTLGRRILRCETAPLCAISAVMFHSGEF